MLLKHQKYKIICDIFKLIFYERSVKMAVEQYVINLLPTLTFGDKQQHIKRLMEFLCILLLHWPLNIIILYTF